MRAKIRDTKIYFDVEGAGLVPEGAAMRERPVAFLSHGGPGADHTGFKPVLSPLAAHMQLVYFDHRGHGRSARSDPATYTLTSRLPCFFDGSCRPPATPLLNFALAPYSVQDLLTPV